MYTLLVAGQVIDQNAAKNNCCHRFSTRRHHFNKGNTRVPVPRRAVPHSASSASDALLYALYFSPFHPPFSHLTMAIEC